MWSFASNFQSTAFLATKIICGFIMPLLIIILCYRSGASNYNYTRIFDAAYFMSAKYSSIVWKVRKVTSRANSRGSTQKIESVILIVILSFFFMWLPNNLFNTSKIQNVKNDKSPKCSKCHFVEKCQIYRKFQKRYRYQK